MKITTQQTAPAFEPFDVVLRVETSAQAAALALLGQANVRVPNAVCGQRETTAATPLLSAQPFWNDVRDVCTAINKAMPVRFHPGNPGYRA